MLPIVLAAAMAMISPPAKFDRGIPFNYKLREVPLSFMGDVCFALDTDHVLEPLPPGTFLMGCSLASKRLIILPIEDDTFPWNHACWLMNARHEAAHAWGWHADHPGGHSYVCYPK